MNAPAGQLLAHRGADRLQHRAALADDHPLLRLALDEDLAPDARAGLLPLGHPSRDRVRQLLAGDGEELLTHELGDPERLGHVGDHVIGIEQWALGQAGDEVLDERVDSLAGRPRTRGSTRSARARRPCAAARAPGAACAMSTLFTTTTASLGTPAATNLSPRPSGIVASITRHTTSTPLSASFAVSLSRVPSAVTGLWMPGVSTNTTCASARLSTPRTWVRVVCGLSETIETFVPRMRLSSVDFPTLGRPMKVTKPERNVTTRSRRRSAPSPDLLGPVLRRCDDRRPPRR